RDDFTEIRRGEPSSVLGVDSTGSLVAQSHLLIKNGGPAGEMLRSLTLVGEFLVSENKYYTFELGKRLFEFHRSLYLMRGQGDQACNIM
ncbi:hypothetical protein CSUI_010948, partial [Cystoisospora suis]